MIAERSQDLMGIVHQVACVPKLSFMPACRRDVVKCDSYISVIGTSFALQLQMHFGTLLIDNIFLRLSLEALQAVEHNLFFVQLYDWLPACC